MSGLMPKKPWRVLEHIGNKQELLKYRKLFIFSWIIFIVVRTTSSSIGIEGIGVVVAVLVGLAAITSAVFLGMTLVRLYNPLAVCLYCLAYALSLAIRFGFILALVVITHMYFDSKNAINRLETQQSNNNN